MFLIFYCENFNTLKIEIGQQMRKLVNLASMHPLNGFGLRRPLR